MMHVTAHSKEIKEGSVFFAFQGAQHDGHQHIAEALHAGASKVYTERPLDTTERETLGALVDRVEVAGPGARRKLGEMASEMCGFPTRQLKMIGITGTSGKTTTTYLTQHLLNGAGLRCARLGTNGGFFEGKTWNTLNTTPDAVTLQKWFQEVLSLGATHVAMEVSSHSLHQDRVWGIAWDVCVFLNLSAEHLDYHSTLEDYFSAKKILFTDHAEFSRQNGKKPTLLTNEDSLYGKRLSTGGWIKTFSVQRQISKLQDTATGLKGCFEIQGRKLDFECPLFGNFQKDNILGALSASIAVLEHSGVGAHGKHLNDLEFVGVVKKMLEALSQFPGVPGRMESIPNSRGIFVFVDYAHKPEALEKVLLSIQGKRIITVFGCGGDRDKTKRPVMGAIAGRLSASVILTSDNPRTEDPQQILAEVEAGLKNEPDHAPYEVIADRAKAISKAISTAQKGDIVLIAGKGHEDYQIFGTEKRHFDDREEARKALQ